MKHKLALLTFFFIFLFINFYIAKILNSKIKNNDFAQKIFYEINHISNQNNFFILPSINRASVSYETKLIFGDSRVANLKSFFRKYNSPLYDYAEKIVEVSDRYHFDYRLLPAIAMQESNLCLKIPENSYNCWGWGIYGDKVTKFNSYNEAIEMVAKGIKEEYLDKGLVTASQIMKKYTPPSLGSWAKGVNLFIKLLE